MKIDQLYAKTPVGTHQEIIIRDGKLYFENEEYVMDSDGELRLVHSNKTLEQRLAAIDAKLGI